MCILFTKTFRTFDPTQSIINQSIKIYSSKQPLVSDFPIQEG